MSSTPIRVFISYASRYEDWVKTLHDNLEKTLAAAGRQPKLFLDQVDLSPGSSWVNQLQAGLDDAEHLVLVATPEAMASSWVEAEWQGFVTERPQWQGSVHVVWLVETPLPAFLRPIQRVDFQRHEDATYCKALGELASSLLGQAAPEPGGIEIPLPPPSGLPVPLRNQLLDWLEPMLRTKSNRRSIAVDLGLHKTALNDHPSKRCAASAALVWATRDTCSSSCAPSRDACRRAMWVPRASTAPSAFATS